MGACYPSLAWITIFLISSVGCTPEPSDFFVGLDTNDDGELDLQEWMAYYGPHDHPWENCSGNDFEPADCDASQSLSWTEYYQARFKQDYCGNPRPFLTRFQKPARNGTTGEYELQPSAGFYEVDESATVVSAGAARRSSPGANMVRSILVKQEANEISDAEMGAIRNELQRYFDVDELASLQFRGSSANSAGRYAQFSINAGLEGFPNSSLTLDVHQTDALPGWQVAAVMLIGQHTLPDFDKPIFYSGAVLPDTASALVMKARQYWDAVGGGAMEIQGVSTTKLPPMKAQPPKIGPVSRTAYSVQVASLEPRPTPRLDTAGDQSFGLMSSSTSLPQYSIQLEYEEGEPIVTDVYGWSGANERQLVQLRSALDPSRHEDRLRRQAAARQALPEPAREAPLLSEFMMIHGGLQAFNMIFAEVPISPRRAASPFVTCVPDGKDNWQCRVQEYSSFKQTVDSQAEAVDLGALSGSEAQIDAFVAELRAALLEQPKISVADDELLVTSIIPQDDKFKAFFAAGRARYEVIFDNSGFVRIDTLKKKYEVPSDPGNGANTANGLNGNGIAVPAIRR